MRIRIVSAVRSRASWAKVARAMVVALDAIGVSVVLEEDDDGIAEPNLLLEPPVERALARSPKNADCDLLITRPERFATYSRSPLVSGLMVFEATHWPESWVNMASLNLDFVVVPSNFCRASLLSSGFTPERVVVVPHGIDGSIFHAQGEYGVSRKGEPVRILFFGTPSRRKGLSVLVSAISALSPVLKSQIALTIKTEDWPLRPDGEASLDMLLLPLYKSGITVRFNKEFLSETVLADLIKTHDLACFPHFGEGFCMSMLETMACGLPVIATDWSGPRDFFDSECGWPIRPGPLQLASSFLPESFPQIITARMRGPDPASLREALIEALTRPDLRLAKGFVATRRAANFSWKRVVTSYCRHIERFQGGEGLWLGAPNI